MNDEIERKINLLEKEDMKTFLQLNPYFRNHMPSLNFDSCYLYHGIRGQNQLDVLLKILNDGILAGKNIKSYSYYSDNCNNGEYVSLLDKKSDNNLEYSTFIEPNICLVVSPLCEAYKTIYVNFYLWEIINKYYPNLKNRYSYAYNEYQVKDKVPVELIEAIGIPYQLLLDTNRAEQAKILKNEIINILTNQGIDIPIVDTSNNNKTILSSIKKI